MIARHNEAHDQWTDKRSRSHSIGRERERMVKPGFGLNASRHARLEG